MLQNDFLRLPPFHFNDRDPYFHFDADPDPDPIFHSDADPDSAFQNDADPCGSGSATLMDRYPIQFGLGV